MVIQSHIWVYPRCVVGKRDYDPGINCGIILSHVWYSLCPNLWGTCHFWDSNYVNVDHHFKMYFFDYIDLWWITTHSFFRIFFEYLKFNINLLRWCWYSKIIWRKTKLTLPFPKSQFDKKCHMNFDGGSTLFGSGINSSMVVYTTIMVLFYTTLYMW